MMKSAPNRIRELREAKGLTIEQLSDLMSLSVSYVSRLESGDRNLSVKHLNLFAQALNVSPQEILISPERTFPSNGNAPAIKSIDRIRVVGEVSAGQWREVTYSEFDEYHIPGVIDDRWKPEDVFALVVKGSSINRQAKDGSYVVCLQAYAAPREMKDGDWVVVERIRGDLIETTVKKAVALQDGGWSLRPDSDDPRHQEDIPLDPERCAGCDEVRVSAYVLDFIKPATRF